MQVNQLLFQKQFIWQCFSLMVLNFCISGVKRSVFFYHITFSSTSNIAYVIYWSSLNQKNPDNLSKSRKMYEICFNNCETSPFPNIPATLVFGFVEGSHSIIPANSLRKKKQGKKFFVKLV